ncbi:MAG: sugar phosphate isomerase/epimerase family protein [Prevotella sp.]
MKKTFLLLLLLTAGSIMPHLTYAQPRYQIGVCDWMILKRQKLGEFKLAKELGCDGIEMDMGGLGRRMSFDNKMRDPQMVKTFLHHADSFNIKIGAVAMSGFYGQSFATKESRRWLVQDCLNTMEKLGVTTAFLPLGGCGNEWTENKEQRQQIIWLLRETGEMAKQKGMVIGIDTPLDAQGNIDLLEEIGSDGIKIFYKFQTAIENKRDIAKEIKTLGKERICAIHATNTDGALIRHDKKINMKAIKKALDKTGWSGWLFVERSRDTSDVRNVKKNYGENVKYLKEILQ